MPTLFLSVCFEGRSPTQFAVVGRASLPQTCHAKMFRTHCIAYPIVVSLLSLPLQFKCTTANFLYKNPVTPG